VAGGGNADAGVIAAGASATGSLGAGFFYNRNTGLSGGSLCDWRCSRFRRVSRSRRSGPDEAGCVRRWPLWRSRGSLFLTNAGSVRQLSGPFSTLNFNVGISVAQLQVSYAKGGNIWYLQISPPLGGIECRSFCHHNEDCYSYD
jgi:hypothetical protein